MLEGGSVEAGVVGSSVEGGSGTSSELGVSLTRGVSVGVKGGSGVTGVVGNSTLGASVSGRTVISHSRSVGQGVVVVAGSPVAVSSEPAMSVGNSASALVRVTISGCGVVASAELGSGSLVNVEQKPAVVVVVVVVSYSDPSTATVKSLLSPDLRMLDFHQVLAQISLFSFSWIGEYEAGNLHLASPIQRTSLHGLGGSQESRGRSEMSRSETHFFFFFFFSNIEALEAWNVFVCMCVWQELSILSLSLGYDSE